VFCSYPCQWTEHVTKRKRLLIGLGIVVIVGGIYLRFFGVQTGCALMVRYWYRKMPDAAKIPLPLPDPSISNVPHKKISYLGYELEVPWDDIDEQKDKTAGSIHLTYFRSGNVFWFSTFPPKDFVNTVMKTAKLDPRGFQQLIGEDAFESDYAFHQRMLQITPSAITPFVSRRQAVAGEMLLLIKAISMPKAGSGIFTIQAPGFEGFQFENPQTRPFRVTDELFSDDGGIDLIFIQKTDGSAPTISQPEINRVIRSIRKLPVQVVKSNGTIKGN
jgi:hypothetical protein